MGKYNHVYFSKIIYIKMIKKCCKLNKGFTTFDFRLNDTDGWSPIFFGYLGIYGFYYSDRLCSGVDDISYCRYTTIFPFFFDQDF